MAEKLTWMVLKVDLDCPDCYKDVRKILNKFPEIRDQVFHMQANEVRITVVCSNPQKIRDKLYSRGGKVIKSVEIRERTKQPEKATDQRKPTATESMPGKNPAAGRETAPAEPEGVPASGFVPPAAGALGIPVSVKYNPFPFGPGCPLCGCPCYHGYVKGMIPPPQ